MHLLRHLVLTALPVWALAACGSAIDPHRTVGADDVSAVDAAPRDDRAVVPDDVPGDVPQDVPVGTCTTAATTAQPSRQTVRFHFAAPSVSRWLMVHGQYCEPLAIERIADTTTALSLGLGFQCGCECAPPIIGADELVTLEAGGAGATYAWDARAFSACTRYIDCRAMGFGGGTTATLDGALAPVEPGHYRASFGIFDARPTGCVDDHDGGLRCGSTTMGRPFEGSAYPEEQCNGWTRTVQVEFDVPASGDVDVSVDPG